MFFVYFGVVFSRGGNECPFLCPPGNPEILESEIPIWDQNIIFSPGKCRKVDVFIILWHFVHSKI